jgi:hypothetical protein
MGYDVGDRILVYLSTRTRDNQESGSRFCKVVLVGMYDLVCETEGTFTKLFKVSKKRCVKIEKKEYMYEEHHPVKPKIGDLITSLRETFSKGRDSFTGVVEDIIYNPTDNHEEVFIIRTGASKTVRAYLENIIIIESAN